MRMHLIGHKLPCTGNQECLGFPCDDEVLQQSLGLLGVRCVEDVAQAVGRQFRCSSVLGFGVSQKDGGWTAPP